MNESSHLLSPKGPPAPVSKDCLLHCLTAFSCFTVFWLVTILLIQLFLVGMSFLRADGPPPPPPRDLLDKILTLSLSPFVLSSLPSPPPSLLAVIETGVRLYLAVFSAIAILIELEITPAARSSSLCQTWEYRGLGFVFLGLLHAYTYLDEDFEIPIVLRLLNLTAYSLITSGVGYIILGLAKTKRIRDEKMARYIQLISFMEVRTLTHPPSVLPHCSLAGGECPAP